MHGTFGKPELIPIDPETIVELTAIRRAAPGADMNMPFEWIEREQCPVFCAAPALARQHRLLGREIEVARQQRLEISSERVSERRERAGRDAPPIGERFIR